jgi:hypothetical protein
LTLTGVNAVYFERWNQNLLSDARLSLKLDINHSIVMSTVQGIVHEYCELEFMTEFYTEIYLIRTLELVSSPETPVHGNGVR